jgi:ubiquinone/menaquinone biosynthesis C-methylase UbiE
VSGHHGTGVGVDYDRVWREAYGDLQRLGPTHRHMRRRLSKVLQGLEFETVLDVGCGAGDNMSLLGEFVDSSQMTGADVSAEALQRADRAWPSAEFEQLDIETKRLDRTWDLVFCSLVLEHLPKDEAALENMRAMTGRALVLTTIAGNYERYRPWEDQVGHVRNYGRGELEAKLSRAGFEVERASYWGFPFFSPLARLAQNRMKATPEFDGSQGLVASLLYWLYFLNLPVGGDLLTVLARPSRNAG